MLVISIEAAAFGTNCYLVAPERGEECVIVDPGVGVEDQVAATLQQHGLRPAAVLLTHGHLDHTYAVTPVCAGTTAAYIHEDDRYRLTDPLASTSPALLMMLEQQFGTRASWAEPETVIDLAGGQTLELGGLSLDVTHAPGHTEGSVLFGLAGVPTGMPDEVDRTVLTGDVLFAGSIGRTDLPGGDHGAMQRSLRDVILPLPDSSLVLPGHGPATTMARERMTNPFLTSLT
ncbi:MBL fold metallo-hydrolase [Ornithinimicrobium ciconiae]|uniref:MBL fold metallo-hydrolase n=1 Tax=Ornithinimicrobium ciconiae TaxID=2594265 RepID=A0A516GBB0_9MICO|nr:MBL fold metallo-hydrolase [Ornithinimicrobium ciconiae]QDO88660.1 MBL fold metallo-hydrolase [Ornithinimicrobium ciconiae]